MRSTTTTSPTIAIFCASVLIGATLWPVAPAVAQQPSESGGGQDSAEEQSAEQDEPSFKELTQRAGRAFGQKDYEGAAEAFKQAYEIRQVPNLLYNIGRTLEKQGEFEEAVTYYERFVSQPDVEHKARRDALERLKTLREVIALREEGEQDQAERVQSERDASEDTALAQTDVDDKDASGQAGDQPADDQPDQNQPDQNQLGQTSVEESYTLAYTFTGMGVASLAAGGVFAALAAGSSSDADDAATLSARRSAAESGELNAGLADGFVAGGALLSAVGLYFFLAPPTHEVAGADSAASLQPSVGRDGASVTFTLEF